MTPDFVFLILICGLALFCLLIFGIPILLVRYRPGMDKKDFEKIDTVAILVLFLLLFTVPMLTNLIDFVTFTGSISQATISLGVIIVIMLVSVGCIYAFNRITGMEASILLGFIAAALVSSIWLYTSDLVLALIVLLTLLILLFIIFISKKKTRTEIDLSSDRTVGSAWVYARLLKYILFGGPVLVLMMTNSVPFALLMFCIVAYLCYGRLFPFFSQYTEDEMTDLQEEVVNINLPYDKAFESCKNAVGLFKNPDWTEIVTSDSKSGIISIQVYTVTNLLTKCATRLTLSLERAEPTQTRVNISAVTSDPVIALPRNPSGMNRIYVDRMAGYIRKTSYRM
jgi:hypothetical protein